jgi:hypothetical protein
MISGENHTFAILFLILAGCIAGTRIQKGQTEIYSVEREARNYVDFLLQLPYDVIRNVRI